MREDEAAAEATGVGAFRHKLLALVLSTAMAGLTGGVGTVHGPVLGALFYVILKEVLALWLVELHLLVFGALFILVVLFLPGGPVELWSLTRGLIACRD
ncbi:MAG: hypothetical protein Q8S00_20935 [Deltaproteobacteria bacterium]|nr:hypothetical protein [Deltaproteobacteria bacterium]